MKKVCALVLGSMVATATLGSFHTEPAHARPNYKKEFDKKYIKDPPATEPEKALKAAAAGAKCGICHTGPEGKDKKKRNDYGEAFGKLLPKKNEKDEQKINDALDGAAKEKVDPADPNSPSFGDRINKGELPASPEK